jgi:hypothetical protein
MSSVCPPFPSPLFSIAQLLLLATYSSDIDMLDTDRFVATSFVRQGFMPCAPLKPTVACSIRVLELYRIAHLRCPRLARQPWVKALCDLHGVSQIFYPNMLSISLPAQVPFKRYLSRQFSICFDLYLDIRALASKRVQVALGRDTPNWRILHACPACTYKLEGEAQLIFELLYTMDGNDSLKRILRRGRPPPHVDGEEPIVAPSSEHIDSRDGGGDYFLSREKVDAWAKVVLEEMLAEGVSEFHLCTPPSF